MVTKNSIGSNIPIELSKGGTNAITMATNTGILKYNGTSLVTSSTALVNSSNILVNSSQPAFLVRNEGALNVTGDGTEYTLTYTTEIFDQGNCFDGTSTFTAPVTGIYVFNSNIWTNGNLTTHTALKNSLVTTSATYSKYQRAALCRDNNSNLIIYTNFIVPMTAGDTAYVTIAISNGTKVVDIIGGSNTTYFSGYLFC